MANPLVQITITMASDRARSRMAQDDTPAKKTKTEVDYQQATSTKKCGKCVHYKGGDTGTCELVAGKIRSIDTCNLFKRRDDGKSGIGVYAFDRAVKDEGGM